MHSVLVITTNLKQAAFRLRIDALRPLLRDSGFDLDVQIRPRNWLERRLLLRSAGDYRAVILQRKLLDPFDARLLRRHAKKILYDIDDSPLHHAHAVGRLSQWRTNRRFEATTRILDHVVAGNEHLAQVFTERGLPVTVLPTCVDPAAYRVKEHTAADPIHLVWIGSNSTLPYLAEIVPALRDIPGLRLITIADRTLENPGVALEHIPWSQETEAASLLRGDIGIAPTPTSKWTLGKSGFKIIQYMAAGLPTIASPVGANAQIVRPNQTGLLATTAKEWIDAIQRLAGDVELRQGMGHTGRILVEQDYSLSRALSVWKTLLA